MKKNQMTALLLAGSLLFSFNACTNKKTKLPVNTPPAIERQNDNPFNTEPKATLPPNIKEEPEDQNMNNYLDEQLNNIFGDTFTDSFDTIVNHYEKNNYSVEQIAKDFEKLDPIYQAGIHLTSHAMGYMDLYKRINDAMDMVRDQRMEKIHEAIKNGTVDAVLEGIPWSWQLDLKVSIEVNARFDGNRGLTEQEKVVVDVLEESIKPFLEKEIEKNRLISDEEYQESTAYQTVENTMNSHKSL